MLFILLLLLNDVHNNLINFIKIFHIFLQINQLEDWNENQLVQTNIISIIITTSSDDYPNTIPIVMRVWPNTKQHNYAQYNAFAYEHDLPIPNKYDNINNEPPLTFNARYVV